MRREPGLKVASPIGVGTGAKSKLKFGIAQIRRRKLAPRPILKSILDRALAGDLFQGVGGGNADVFIGIVRCDALEVAGQ